MNDCGSFLPRETAVCKTSGNPALSHPPHCFRLTLPGTARPVPSRPAHPSERGPPPALCRDAALPGDGRTRLPSGTSTGAAPRDGGPPEAYSRGCGSRAAQTSAPRAPGPAAGSYRAEDPRSGPGPAFPSLPRETKRNRKQPDRHRRNPAAAPAPFLPSCLPPSSVLPPSSRRDPSPCVDRARDACRQPLRCAPPRRCVAGPRLTHTYTRARAGPGRLPSSERDGAVRLGSARGES